MRLLLPGSFIGSWTVTAIDSSFPHEEGDVISLVLYLLDDTQWLV